MRRLAIAVIASLALALVASPAMSESADPGPTQFTVSPTTELGQFHGKRDAQIVADPIHGHVFISNVGAHGEVVVTDLSGKILTTLESAAGATGMALGPGNKTLYVGLPSGIAAIDTTTLAGETYPIGDLTAQGVAVAGGLVWFESEWVGSGVSALDPATGKVWPALIKSDAATLASSLTDPNVLFTGNWTMDNTWSIEKFVIRPGSTPTAIRTVVRTGSGWIDDLVVSADGKEVVGAISPLHGVWIKTFRASDLAPTQRSLFGRMTASVARDSIGDIAIGAGFASDGLSIYRPGAVRPTYTIRFGGVDQLLPHGLAIANGVAYATGVTDGGNRVLYVVPIPLPVPLTMTTDTVQHWFGSVAEFGQKVHITAHLRGIHPDNSVSIYATVGNEPRTLISSGSFTNGSFSTSYRVKRKTTFTVVYDGDSRYRPIDRTVYPKAQVTQKASGGYAKSGRYLLVHKAKQPKWTATVRPYDAGDTVFFETQTFRSGHWSKSVFTDRQPADANGNFTFGLTGDHTVGEKVRVRVNGGGFTSWEQYSAWSYVKFTR